MSTYGPDYEPINTESNYTAGQHPIPAAYNYHSYATEPQRRPEKGKADAKAPKMVAFALAMVLVSAAAGGGTAMLVLNNQSATIEATSVGPAATIKTTDTTGASIPESGSVAAVAATAADSVVEIDTKVVRENFFARSSLVAGSGSGVIISEDGYIVTNNHVVQQTDAIVVRTKDGTEYEATLIGNDPQTDLAVLKVDATGLKTVTFADSDNIVVGDMAVAIGNPLGELGGTVTNGIISATGREVTVGGDAMTLLQTSAAINPGNSGGGLFDANGNLIGIVNAKSAGVEIEGLGFAIPANTVQKVVQDIIDRGYVTGRPVMGIQVVEINDARTAMMYGITKAGIYVAEPGNNEGLQAGDRFVFIGGQSIESSGDITSVLRAQSVGDTISVTVERDGKEVQTEVTLQEQVPQQEPQEQEPAQELPQ